MQQVKSVETCEILVPPFSVMFLLFVALLKYLIFVKEGGSETEVTWEDQQNINKFSKLNNRFHELEDELRIAKVSIILCSFKSAALNRVVGVFIHFAFWVTFLDLS